MTEPIAYGVFLFIRSTESDRILVFKETEELKPWLFKTLNQFSLPGGTIQPNEDALQALKREVHEEIGLEYECTPQPILTSTFNTISGDIVAYTVYELCIDQEVSSDERSIWMSIEDFAQVDLGMIRNILLNTLLMKGLRHTSLSKFD